MTTIKNIIDLYNCDYNLFNIFAMNQFWGEGQKFVMSSPRKTNALLWFCGCSGKYSFCKNTLNISKNSIVYVPKGALYELEFIKLNKDGPHTILIEFNPVLSNGTEIMINDEIFILSENIQKYIELLFRDMANEYLSPMISLPNLKSSLYKILSEFAAKHRYESINSHKYKSISKGIQYMESNINQNMSIEEISEMCHVGVSTFRRLFKDYSGMSPTEYRTKAKVDYAKKLLETQVYGIKEICNILRYDDPAYFCRVFKKKTGYTPGQYAKIFI